MTGDAVADRRGLGSRPGQAGQLRRTQRPGSLPEDCVRSLTEAIEERVFPRGSQLPSEAELAAQLGVSRATLREALRILADRQLILRKHGLGTFVAEGPIEKDLHRNFGITAMIRAAGYSPGTASQRVTAEPANSETATALRLGPGTPVTVLERLRLADKRPVVFSVEAVPSRLAGPQEIALLDAEHQSLYWLLHRHCGVSVYRGQAELVPVKANGELAIRLETRRGAPLLCIKQTDFDGADTPVLYSIEYHVADWVRFTVERIGPGSAVDD
jgi:GntR family transcriptional regulator